MEGWIKLHRKLLEWEWYDDINVVRLFLHLLLTANYEQRSWHGKKIERGSLITGRIALAQETSLTEQQVRTALKKLESTGEITTTSTNQYTIITVNNYDSYQSIESGEQPTNNQQITNEQPTNNQRITTTKEIKNKRNKEDNIDYAQAVNEMPEEIRLPIMRIAEDIEMWINYKKTEFRKGYKSATSFKIFLKHLCKLGNGNPETMKAIIEQSIANRYEGIFELKTQKYGNNNGASTGSIQERAARIAEYAFAANGM